MGFRTDLGVSLLNQFPHGRLTDRATICQLKNNFLLDLRRASLLVWVVTRTVLPLLVHRLIGIKDDAAAIGARLRRSMQRLGITYVKLGQFLAMRFDILPEDVCRELARLFDKVPPMPNETVRSVLESEFSQRVEELFQSFDWECVAAASVAQVHKATAKGGETVAVKVQRPSIARIFGADIRNFRRVAGLADNLGVLGPQSIVEAIDEFERYTKREMDFLVEGATADLLRRNAGPGESAPRIYWDLTTSRVLTMEFIEGYKLSEIIHLMETGRTAELKKVAPDLDIQLAVQNIARACLRQFFVTGFFHADPHPGNIILRNDGTVVFIDFGIFGQLTPERRETFASYIEHLALGNVEQSYRHFMRLLQPTPQTDMQQLKREVHEIMHRWHKASGETEVDVTERHLGTYFSAFIGAIRRNNVKMSMDTLLFWRAILTLDATALRFGHQFDLLDALREFFKRTRPTPVERLLTLARDHGMAKNLVKLKQELPQRAGVLLGTSSRGQYELGIRESAGPARRSRQKLSTGLVVLAIVSPSLAVLSIESSPNTLGQALLWTTTLLLSAVTVVRLVRN